MQFWNFVHSATPLHVYEFLALVLAAAMVVIAVIHTVKTKKENNKTCPDETPSGQVETKEEV